MFKIVFINLGFIVSLSFTIFVPALFAAIPVLGVAVRLMGFLWCCAYLSAAALSLKSLSDYGNFGFADFFGNLKTCWPAGLFFGGIVLVGYVLFTMVIPFYLGMNSLLGLLLAAALFWAMLVTVLALQFFFVIRARLEAHFLKAVKKCFIIFFDNPLFCAFTFAHNAVMLIFSGIVAFLFPGPAGILLFLDQGMRLRLMKYDWLEANPGADRSKVPWEELLVEEQEKTGRRSLRSFIFPWKD